MRRWTRFALAPRFEGVQRIDRVVRFPNDGRLTGASSIVGVIGLFGVAVQNSLVLITQTKGFLGRRLSLETAVREAALGRVRPKLMTAGAAILGLAPMLFGLGGSELERPLAIVMVGGLVTSTLLTLLVLPAVYARFGSPGSQADRRAPAMEERS
jgi:heavy metal efflux system protein